MGIREDDSLAFALQAVAGATLSTQVLVVITTISSILSLLKVTENMVHPGGFEPPTARFVAEYSIQLSYGCIGKIYFTADIDIATKAISSKRWCIREDYSPCGSQPLSCRFFILLVVKLKRFSHYRSHQIWLALRYSSSKKTPLPAISHKKDSLTKSDKIMRFPSHILTSGTVC